MKFVRQNDSLRALQLQFHDIDTQVDNYVFLTLFTDTHTPFYPEYALVHSCSCFRNMHR